jgi:hypothetical protein
MLEKRRKRPLLGLALAAALIAIIVLARNFWVLGYFPGPHRTAQGNGAGSPVTASARGDAGCPDCHDSIGDLHDRGPHRSLLCEDCHGAIEGHVSEGERVGPMPKSRNIARLCSLCHREMNARSQTATKLNLETHVVETGALFSDRICLDCHLPHDPRP